ncbi:MAG TPA: hypothetical protein VN715_18975 [Roseiarcus sp.]|nr:hypothetical protein [Roseiarcus sp.]
MHAVTRAAEGFDRRAFTVSEILRMQEAGILSPAETFELIEGEIVPMQAKSHIHELLKSALNYKLARTLPDLLWLGVETTIYLSDDTFVEPASLYARHKFQEYWVVDAPNRRTCQFAGPRGKSRRRRTERGPDEVLTHAALPGFSIRLSES